MLVLLEISGESYPNNIEDGPSKVAKKMKKASEN